MKNKKDYKLQVTRLYTETMNATSKIIINRGGAGSGKSVAVLQVIINKFLTEKNKQILIVRKTLPSLKSSIYLEFIKILEAMDIMGQVKENKNDLIYRYSSNYIRFCSIDDNEKIKSTNYNYIFMEEATEFLYADYLQLKLRLREPSTDGKRNQMYMNFNPIDEFHWIKEKVIEKESKKVTEILSNYKDNPFLQQDYIDELEGFIDLDINYYRIYALGEWGKLENLIYRNWSVSDEYNPVEGESFFGVDFGYNDPIVLVEVAPSSKNKKELFLTEHIYERGLTTSDFIALMKRRIPKNKRFRPFYCDSAEPDRIVELRRAGFNAKKSNKSIKDGIDFVKRWHLKYDQQSTNLIKESRAYSWTVNKEGDILDEPIDFLNHTMDAIRYAIYTHMGKRVRNFVRWI